MYTWRLARLEFGMACNALNFAQDWSRSVSERLPSFEWICRVNQNHLYLNS